MKNFHAIAAVIISFLALSSCSDPGGSTSTLTTVQSTLPSLRINANQVANLYRQAKAAGASEFQGSVSAEEILTSLENGVHGGGINNATTFKISPINDDDREKVIALLEDILGL